MVRLNQNSQCSPNIYNTFRLVVLTLFTPCLSSSNNPLTTSGSNKPFTCPSLFNCSTRCPSSAMAVEIIWNSSCASCCSRLTTNMWEDRAVTMRVGRMDERRLSGAERALRVVRRASVTGSLMALLKLAELRLLPKLAGTRDSEPRRRSWRKGWRVSREERAWCETKARRYM